MKYLLFITMSLFLYCCQNKGHKLNTLEDFKSEYQKLTEEQVVKFDIGIQPEKTKVISFDPSVLNNENKFNYIDTIILVPLQTKDECLIGEISKVIYQNGSFFILDKKQDNLFVFDKTGNYKSKVSNLGRAPGEYMDITDFCLSPKGDIYLLDDEERKIMIFNPNLTFIKSINLEQNYINIRVSNTKLFLSLFYYNSDKATHKEYHINCLDLEKGTIKKMFPFNPNLENAAWHTSNMGLQDLDNGNIIYFPHFGKNVYILNELGQLQDCYRYTVSDFPIPTYISFAARNRSTNSKAYNICKSKSYGIIKNVIDLQDYLCAEFVVGPSFTQVIYNKKNGKTSGYDTFTETSDITQEIVTRLQYVGGMPANTLIGYLQVGVLQIIQEIANEENMSLIPYKNTIDSLEDTDNPILVLVKIKMC